MVLGKHGRLKRSLREDNSTLIITANNVAALLPFLGRANTQENFDKVSKEVDAVVFNQSLATNVANAVSEVQHEGSSLTAPW